MEQSVNKGRWRTKSKNLERENSQLNNDEIRRADGWLR